MEAAHVRLGSIPHGKREVGAAEKPSDFWVVPLTPEAHRTQHSGSEAYFWQANDIDPIVIAALLYAHSGDIEAGTLVCQNARIVAPWRG